MGVTATGRILARAGRQTGVLVPMTAPPWLEPRALTLLRMGGMVACEGGPVHKLCAPKACSSWPRRFGPRFLMDGREVARSELTKGLASGRSTKDR